MWMSCSTRPSTRRFLRAIRSPSISNVHRTHLPSRLAAGAAPGSWNRRPEESGLEDSVRRLRLRPKAKNVPVRIFDLKLVGPAEIPRRASDVCALGREFGKKCIRVLNADPEPGAWLALFTFA